MSTGNEGLKLTSQFKILRLFCFFCNFWWNLHCCTTSCRAKRVLWHGTQGCGQAWLHIKRFVNTKFWPKAFKCLINMALLYIKIPPILVQVLPCDAMIAPPPLFHSTCTKLTVLLKNPFITHHLMYIL